MSKWYEKAVFYHMYPLGMVGAPKENVQGEVTGRFDELNRWVPHIRELGCNAIYIGPLFESSRHGYDTRDYKLVDRRLGTNEDFKNFVDLCHELEIKVVVDGVFNHTGREFFAFQDIQEQREGSPYKDWYKGVNFGWGSPMGDSFGYEAWQGHYELPCLNLFHPEVRNYLFDVIQFWIDEFGIDGIRLDCANILDFNFMKEMRSRTEQMKKDFWLMGEVIHGDYSRWVNPDTLHSVTNYELHKSLYSGHNDHNYFEVAHNVRRLEAIAPNLYTFLDNHDEDRIASKLKHKEHLIPIHTLLLTLPGIPSIYYGGEWATEGQRTSTCDDMLRPCISIDNAGELHIPLTDFITQLARIHTEHPAFHGGSYRELLLTNRQYAFAREKDGQTVVIAVNNDDSDITLQVPLPCNADKAQNLLEDTPVLIENQKLMIHLKGNDGTIVKLGED